MNLNIWIWFYQFSLELIHFMFPFSVTIALFGYLFWYHYSLLWIQIFTTPFDIHILDIYFGIDDKSTTVYIILYLPNVNYSRIHNYIYINTTYTFTSSLCWVYICHNLASRRQDYRDFTANTINIDHWFKGRWNEFDSPWGVNYITGYSFEISLDSLVFTILCCLVHDDEWN